MVRVTRVREPLLADWSSLPPLGESEVQVFALCAKDHPGLLERAYQVLSPAERERAARFLVEGARTDFVVGRAALRTLAGVATGCAPQLVEVVADGFGKPLIGGVCCNVSHSHGLIYIALCRAAALGVDVEWVDRELEALEIAEANFTATETARIAAEPEGLPRAQDFYRLWTRKEAVCKAHGHGLALPLREIALPNERDGFAVVHSKAASTSSSDTHEDFWVSELPAPAGFTAALAVQGKVRRRVCCYGEILRETSAR